MLNPISLDVSQITAEAQAEAQARREAVADTTKRTFQALHGIYGNVFFSRYQTGEHNDDGEDKGVLGAMSQWAYELRNFDVETVKDALDRAKVRYTDFPPTLPQFSELCRAVRPREMSKASKVLLTMGQAITSRYARQAREINARHAAQAVMDRTGYVEPKPGLTGLKQAIAGAVGAAGGDEAAELVRLDRLFQTGVGETVHGELAQ